MKIIDWKRLKDERSADKGCLISINGKGEFLNVSERDLGLPGEYIEIFADIASKTHRYILKEEYKERDLVIPFEIEDLTEGFAKIVTRNYRYTICDRDKYSEWYEKNDRLHKEAISPNLRPPSLIGTKDGLGYVVYTWAQSKIPDINIVEVEAVEVEKGKV